MRVHEPGRPAVLSVYVGHDGYHALSHPQREQVPALLRMLAQAYHRTRHGAALPSPYLRVYRDSLGFSWACGPTENPDFFYLDYYHTSAAWWMAWSGSGGVRRVVTLQRWPDPRGRRLWAARSATETERLWCIPWED